MRLSSLALVVEGQTGHPALPSPLGAFRFDTGLAREIVSVEDDVGRDPIVYEHADPVHCEVNEPGK